MTGPARSVRSKALVALAAIAVIMAAIILSRGTGTVQGEIPTGLARKGTLELKITMSGTIEAKRSLTLSPAYSGYVKKLFVRVGDRVKTGDPIVLVSTSLRSRNDDDSLPMRAPFAGTVVQVLKQEGEAVEASETSSQGVVRIDDLSDFYLRGSVGEREVWFLRSGLKAEIRVTSIPEKTFQGNIESVAIASTQEQKSQGALERSRSEFPVRIRLKPGESQLRPGLNATAQVVAYRLENVLVTELEYVGMDENGPYVTTIDGKRRAIQIGKRNDDLIEIVSGVVDGERLTPLLSRAKSSGG